MKWVENLNHIQININYLINWLTIYCSKQMGSFRSQPDLQKHTDSAKGINLDYVSTHMCGTPLFI